MTLDTTILAVLHPFCSDDPELPTMLTPFTVAGWTYATDKRCIIRVPYEGGAPAPSWAPKATALFDRFDAPGFAPNWRALPALPAGVGEPIACAYCNGSARGKVPGCECAQCGGEGTVPDYRTVRFGSVFFRGEYLRKLATLPACELEVGMDDTGDRPLFADLGVAFRFAYGQGLLMPMSEDYKGDAV
jgi:hypothetical protein